MQNYVVFYELSKHMHNNVKINTDLHNRGLLYHKISYWDENITYLQIKALVCTAYTYQSVCIYKVYQYVCNWC